MKRDPQHCTARGGGSARPKKGLAEQVTSGRNEAALHLFHRCSRDACGIEPLKWVGAA